MITVDKHSGINVQNTGFIKKGLLRTVTCGFSARVTGCLTLALVATALLLPGRSTAQDVVLDEIAVIVNDGIVLSSDIDRETRFLQQRARAANQQLPASETTDERILERLIDREIQRQRAARAGIEIDPGSINRAIEKVASENKLNTLEFRELLQQQGFDFAYYRSSIAHELLLQRLVRTEVESSITVTEQEINDYLASQGSTSAEPPRYRLQHILVAVPAGAPETQIEQARQNARQIIRRFNDGEDFSTLAREISDGPRAANGGDLGLRQAAELPEFIATVLPQLSRGDISEPVRSNNGFHVVLVNDIQDASVAEPTEDLRVRHIFIASDASDTTQEARRVLAAARERIIAGAAFADVAKELSEDPDSRDNGGELPWLSSGQMPPQMEQTARELPTGRLSEPFRTQFGWHIMEVLERREGRGGNSRERVAATQVLRQQKFAREVDNWQRRLRDEAYVEILTNKGG